jgi:hypothetical protein
MMPLFLQISNKFGVHSAQLVNPCGNIWTKTIYSLTFIQKTKTYLGS